MYILIYAHIYLYICIYLHIHIFIHTHINTMEYYSAIKKKEILPFVITWMPLECIMLEKVGQRKRNTIRSHLCEESKKQSNL